MTGARWVSIAWLWADASDLLWSAYGVSSRIGRFMDRRNGIPLGRIALDEFEMLGEEQPRGAAKENRFKLAAPTAQPPRRMTANQHAALGAALRAAQRQLAGPWLLAKTHRRSVCRRRLQAQLDRLQSLASGYATREHGDDLAHGWYYADSENMQRISSAAPVNQ
jgi:hypothetical protein